MTVKFYTFSKRANSTKRPSGTGTETPTDKTCRLKENTSEHDPVILLEGSNFGYNYAYIGSFGKYYFVRDIVSVANNLTEYHLTEDPLATYKTEIGNTRAHIVFSSTNYDVMAVDPRIVLAATRAKTTVGGSGDTYRIFPDSSSVYILSVFTDSAVAGGSGGIAGCYALDDDGMQILRRWLAQNSIIQSLENYFNGEPLQAIMGCIWLPFALSNIPGADVSALHVGNQVTPASDLSGHAKWITNFDRITKTVSCPIPVRTGYYDFRAFEPYTTGNIYLPGFGMVDLNMGDWAGSSAITVKCVIEVITGNMKYHLIDSNGIVIQTFECNIASQCPVGQVTMNGGGMLAGISSTMQGAASLAAGAVATAATGVAGVPLLASSALSMIAGVSNTVLAANKRGTSVIGNVGGRTVQTMPFVQCTVYSVDTEDPDDADYIAERGRPYMGVATINTLSGYVQCENASVECSGTALEKQEINTFLNSGIYLE